MPELQAPSRRTMARLARRLLPHGPLDLLRQLALFAGAYFLYRIVRGQIDGRAAVAFGNARALVDIEQGMRLFFEPALQSWTGSVPVLMDFASWMYINSHFLVTVVALAWIYLFRNRSFYFVRNMFMVAMAFALVGYVVFPTAPPRLFPELGFEDSVAAFVGFTPDRSGVSALYNPYAAVPSMHVCFALMIGGSLALLVRRRWARALWLAYPLLVTWVVVVTGNHWWLDGAIGALVAAVSAVFAHELLARARPHAWAFAPASSSAGASA